MPPKLEPIADHRARVHRTFRVGDATTVPEWRESPNLRRSLQRMNLGTLLYMAHALGIPIRTEYNHNTRRWNRPLVENVAEELWHWFVQQSGRRTAEAAATDQPPQPAPAPRTLEQAIARGDELFLQDGTGDDNTSSDSDATTHIFRPLPRNGDNNANASAAAQPNDITQEDSATVVAAKDGEK